MATQISILNIGGHPKDAILYAGGTLAKHILKGDRVCTLTPTHGLSHHGRAIEARNRGEDIDMGALMEERRQELVDAAAELGVTDVRFLGYSDRSFCPKRRSFATLPTLSARFAPTPSRPTPTPRR